MNGQHPSDSPLPANGATTTTDAFPPLPTTNGDLCPSSSSSCSEIDFDPSAPETLHDRVSTLSTRVRQLKRKLRSAQEEIASLRSIVRHNAEKEFVGKAEVGIQCQVSPPEGHGWTEVTEDGGGGGGGSGAGFGLSISESIREAANKVQQSQVREELEQRGFVYEATSGFYYDPSSGYYYDAERQLYYDGNTKTYYSYNQDSGTYTAFAAAEEEEAVEAEREEGEEEEEEYGRGGKRRKKEREKRDPEVEERLKEEKEKLLDGIFNLHKCRELEAKKKQEAEEEERKRKKRKNRTEEEKKATKSKWDDDSSDNSGTDDDDRDAGKKKSKRRKRKFEDAKKKKSEKKDNENEKGKSEVEDGEISGSSSSSSLSSSSSSEVGSTKKKKRRKKKKKKLKKKSKKKESERDLKRRKRSGNGGGRSRDRKRRYDNEKDRDKRWTEKRKRDASTSSSYSDEEDDKRRLANEDEILRRKRKDIHKGPILYAEDDARRYAIEDHFPPCIRVIVVASESVEVGSLFIVTKDGASIGSTEESAICVPEEGVSAVQASVTYDMGDRHYLITQTSEVTQDSLLNEDPLSSTASGATSVTLAGYVRALKHGDVVGVGTTRLLCHVHDGMDTCDECEPGQIRAKINDALAKEKSESTAVPSHASKQDWMRNEMKNLKRKFGLEKAAFEGPPAVPGEDNYEDRAEQRRKKKGSSHPSHKKTTAQGTSVKKALAPTNKGHQLLSKMGWSEGKGLGKTDQGIVEPIQVGVRSANAGLGSDSSLTKSMDEPEVTQKEKARLKAQQRFADILAQEDPAS